MRYDIPNHFSIIKKIYPSWGVLFEKIHERNLRAQDIKRILGLSYRQLNDWSTQGLILTVSERASGPKSEGWRKFAIADLLSLAVLRELKSRRLPVEGIGHSLNRPGASLFNIYEIFPDFVYGDQLVFFTNLARTNYIIPCEPNDPSIPIPSEDLTRPESIMMVMFHLNRLMDEIFEKLGRKDFEAIREPESGYRFIINGVPLTLEKLPKIDIDKEVMK